jgi:hypothetical protein
MPLGTATLDFGAFPGKTDASVAVTGQTGILAGSLVEAWIFPATTVEHSVDEHLLEDIRIVAGNVVAGTGFTIYGILPSSVFNDNQNNDNVPLLYGRWNIAWVWS